MQRSAAQYSAVQRSIVWCGAMINLPFTLRQQRHHTQYFMRQPIPKQTKIKTNKKLKKCRRD